MVLSSQSLPEWMSTSGAQISCHADISGNLLLFWWSWKVIVGSFALPTHCLPTWKPVLSESIATVSPH